MKLHLPKQLFTALLAVITLAAPAALTLNSTAWGAEEIAQQAAVQADYSAYDSSKYGYKIVQWQGSPNSGVKYSVCYAPYQLASYTNGEFSFTSNGVVTTNPYQTYVIGADYYTFMIDDVSVHNNNTALYDINDVKWSGIIVTADTNVAKLQANATTGRSMKLGKADSNAAGYTSIARDFELDLNSNTLTIAGTQTWDIVGADTTFKISNLSSNSQVSSGAQLTIKGQGEVNFASALTNSGSITIGDSSSLIISSTITNSGSISTVGGGKIVISDLLSYAGSAYTSLSDGNNGFATYSSVQVINNTGEGSLGTGGVNVQIQGTNYVTTTGAVENVQDLRNYWINEGTVTVGGENATTGTESAEAYVLQGGSLNVAAGQVTLVNMTSAAALNLAENTEAYLSSLLPTGGTTLNVSGTGRFSVGFAPSSGHGQTLNLGTEFNGTLAIREGWMQLQDFRLGEGAVIELISGQHWSDGDSNIAYDILLAAESKESAYVFRNSLTDTLSGKVTGNYLNVGTSVSNNGTLVLANSENEIGCITVGSASTSMGLTIAEDLKVGQITSVNANSTITINAGKQLTISGNADNKDAVSTIAKLSAGSATVTLEANSSLTLGAATHAIGTLTGSGALNMSSSASNASATVATLAGYTGDITIDKAGSGTATFKATTGGKVSLSGIFVLNGAKANIHTNQNNNNRDVNLGNVALTGGATLSLSSDNVGTGYIVTVNELSVTGGGELKTASDKTFSTENDAGWEARFNIATLKGTTTSDTTLRLASTSNTSVRTVFNLSTSDAVIAEEDLFSGNINLGVDNSGDSRKAALNIKNATVAKNAIIHLENSAASSGEVALGIATDGVTLRGITDVVRYQGNTSPKRFIKSGEVGAEKNSFNKLIISTQNENDNFSTAATVGTHLNLQKDGAGSQTFNGDLSAFNGTVTVNQGTLALQSTAVMNNIGDITVTGGKLIFNTVEDLTGTITMTGGSLEIGTWNITTTQEFTTSGDIAVNIGTVNIALANTLESSGADDYFTHIYEGTEKAADGNGYRVQSGDFFLFKGLEWDEAWGTLNVDGYGTVKSEDGNTLVTVSNAGTGLFFINNDATYTDASILGSHGVHLTQGKTLDLAIGDAQTQTLSTELTGEGSLKKSGTGTLALSGANTYSGGTTIAAGTLSVTDAQSLGTGGVTVKGSAELEYAGSTGSTVTALTLEAGAEVNTSSTGTLTATTAAATGAFTKNGTGTLVLSTVSQLSGTVTVNAGILQIGGGDQKLNSAQVNGGTLRLTGTDIINWGDSVNIQVSGGTLDLDARQSVDSTTAITLNNGTIEGDGGANRGYTVGLELHNTSTLTITSTGNSSITTNIGMRKESNHNGGTVKFNVTDGALTVSGKIEKNEPTDATISGKVTKSGAGELILSGNNTYANGTTIEAGTVTTQHTNALGSGGVTMTGGELKITDVADTNSDLSLKGMLEMNATASAKLATAGTTLNLGTTGSVKKTNADGSQYVTIASDGTNAASMTAKTQNAQLVQLAQDASFTIEDMTLTNTTITAATVKTCVNLSNVSASNLALATGKFTMEATPAVGGGGTDVEFGTGVSSLAAGSASLTLNLDMMGAYESIGAVNGVTLTITLDVDVSGANLNSYTVESWQALVGFEQDSWLGEALTKATVTADVTATADTGSGVPTVNYGFSVGEGASVGTLTITISGLNVPEPASATLGLAALMMLCARRRRND